MMFTSERKIRVLVAKPGLDGHDRGAKLIARFLLDAGMNVIYTGRRQTPEMIANTALEEDVDVVGLSFLNGSHNNFCLPVLSLLRAKGMVDRLVIVGGLIPQEDAQRLEEQGISKVFPPGICGHTVAEYIRAHVNPRAFLANVKLDVYASVKNSYS